MSLPAGRSKCRLEQTHSIQIISFIVFILAYKIHIKNLLLFVIDLSALDKKIHLQQLVDLFYWIKQFLKLALRRKPNAH